MTLVADDVLLQATSSQILPELLDAAAWWAGRKDSKCSTSKYSYLQTGEGQTATLCLDGETLKTAKSENYLGMTLTAIGIKTAKSIQRVIAAEAEVTRLTNCNWSSLRLPPSQIGPAYNSVVRYKYTYSLLFLHNMKEIEATDQRLSDRTQRALLKTRENLHVTARKR